MVSGPGRRGWPHPLNPGGWVGSGAAKLYILCHLLGHSSGREAQVVLVAKVPVALGPAAS